MFKRKDYFILIASAVSFSYSVALWFGAFGAPDKSASLFVAVWVPSILALGCFTHLATREKSDE